MNKRNLVIALVGISAAVLLPYVLAFLLAGPDFVFTGFLLNSGDGATYLAKMRQGYDGSWKFTLPFTAEPGEGVFFFLFYLMLGKLARLSSLSLQVMYHLARLVGAWYLLWSLNIFFKQVFSEKPSHASAAFWLSAVGSGMGWLVVLFSEPTADYWVAEAYPFLSMFVNPHFPVGLAIMLRSLTLLLARRSAVRYIRLVAAGLLLSAILPFGIVNGLIIMLIWLAWDWRLSRRSLRFFEWQPLVSFGSLGGPYLLYQYWVSTTHPALASWNAQNVTLTPPLWDFLLSFMPPVLLALIGLYSMRKQAVSPGERILITWFLVGLLVVYFPFSLQRRFLLGWYIPAAGLAVCGIYALAVSFSRLRKRIMPVAFGLALPTNLLILLFSVFGIIGHSPLFFLQIDEERALRWLDEKSVVDSIVLASPEISRWIPGWSGRKVIYGHPYETVNATQEEAWVLEYYRTPGPVDLDILAERGIDYVLVGPRERLIGPSADFSGLPVVFESGQVQILAVEP